MEVYILGGYLAVLLYGILLDNVKGFLEYMTELMNTVIKVYKIKKTHPYTLMSVLGMFLFTMSWFGVFGMLFLVYDFIDFKYKNKEKK